MVEDTDDLWHKLNHKEKSNSCYANKFLMIICLGKHDMFSQEVQAGKEEKKVGIQIKFPFLSNIDDMHVLIRVMKHKYVKNKYKNERVNM